MSDLSSQKFIQYICPGEITVVIRLNLRSNSSETLLQRVFASRVHHFLFNSGIFWTPGNINHRSNVQLPAYNALMQLVSYIFWHHFSIAYQIMRALTINSHNSFIINGQQLKLIHFSACLKFQQTS